MYSHHSSACEARSTTSQQPQVLYDMNTVWGFRNTGVSSVPELPGWTKERGFHQKLSIRHAHVKVLNDFNEI